jgi:hypothetical protein
MHADNTYEEENQGSSDYIKEWFQKIIILGHYFILQHLLESKQLDHLASLHIQTTIKVHFPYFDMSVLLILLCTWLH